MSKMLKTEIICTGGGGAAPTTASLRTTTDDIEDIKENNKIGISYHITGKFKPNPIVSSKSAQIHLEPFDIAEVVIQTESTLHTFIAIPADGKQGLTWTIVNVTTSSATIALVNELGLTRNITMYWN